MATKVDATCKRLTLQNKVMIVLWSMRSKKHIPFHIYTLTELEVERWQRQLWPVITSASVPSAALDTARKSWCVAVVNGCPQLDSVSVVSPADAAAPLAAAAPRRQLFVSWKAFSRLSSCATPQQHTHCK